MKHSPSAQILIYLILIAIACLAAGNDFLEQRRVEPILPSAGLTTKAWLSRWHPGLRATRGDTEVLIYDSGKPGGTALILGGTHPNEPAGYIAAVLIAENLEVTAGRVIIIPRACASGFTATEPQEAFPSYFTLTNRLGNKRRFRVGSRYANILDGWPDPIVYRHHPSGQLLSGPETRNLNRAYPGLPHGKLIEQVAWAVTELVRREGVDVVVDLHEAAPEYPVINAVVAHQRAEEIAAMTTIELQMLGIDLRIELSPLNFHGLIHREIGDFTDASVVLFETAGALQGRLRGATDEALVKESKDPFYEKASRMGKLYVDFPPEGIPLDERVGRHIESVTQLCRSWSEQNPGKTITWVGLPGFSDLIHNGVGRYLK